MFIFQKSEVNIKEGVFVGREICELMFDDVFKTKPKPNGSSPREAFM